MHGRTLRAAAVKGLEGEFVARARRLARCGCESHHSERTRAAVVGRRGRRKARARTARARTACRAAGRRTSAQRNRASVCRRVSTHGSSGIDRRTSGAAARAADARSKRNRNRAKPCRRSRAASPISFARVLGSLDRTTATLPPDEHAARRALRAFGVKFGRRAIFLPRLAEARCGVAPGAVVGRRAAADANSAAALRRASPRSSYDPIAAVRLPRRRGLSQCRSAHDPPRHPRAPGRRARRCRTRKASMPMPFRPNCFRFWAAIVRPSMRRSTRSAGIAWMWPPRTKRRRPCGLAAAAGAQVAAAATARSIACGPKTGLYAFRRPGPPDRGGLTR